MLALLLKTLIAYLLGSVSGSLSLGALRHVDIRQAGSGNAGGTNAFRTQGFRFALGVVLIDIGKGAVAAGLLPGLDLPGLPDAASLEWRQVCCAAAVVLGHCYPLWHGFRGGKGAGSAIGALLAIQPWATLPMILTWLLVLVLSGWVGLSTMLAGMMGVPAMLRLDAPPEHVVFAFGLALFLVFTHRQNIRRMLRGEENRFQRIWVRNWLRRGPR